MNKIFPLSITLFILSSFSVRQQTSNANIIGTYHSQIAFLHDQSETALKIKKNFIFEENVITRGNNYKYKTSIYGKWAQKGDTVILTPLKLKTLNKMMLIHTHTTKTNTDCTTNTNEIFCKTDTFLFKDNALWRIKPLYKEFTKK